MSGKTVSGVFQDHASSASQVNVQEGIPTEARAKEIAETVVEGNKTVSVQTVLAEVKEVLYGQDDLDKYPDISNLPYYIGCIKVSPSVPIDILPHDGNGWVMPIESQIKNYPIIGEMVRIINLGAQTFYFSATNLTNNVNQNANFELTTSSKPGLQFKPEKTLEKINGFIPNIIPRPVDVIPGDIAINGKYDQSIRIGRSGKDDESSVIKIRLANKETEPANILLPKDENLLQDASSIYLVRNENVEIPVKPTAGDATPKQISGAQIILDSDTITFNSKRGDVNVFSNTRLNMVSKRRATLIGSKILIGDVDEAKMQYAVLGKQLCAFLAEICGELARLGSTVTPSTSINILGMTIPVPQLMGAGAQLQAYFSQQMQPMLEQRLLSTNVMISKRSREL